MRYALAGPTALAVSVCLWPVTPVHAFDTNGASAVAQTQPATQPAPQPTAAPPAPADPPANSEDAMRHAKRAACRKDARDKKLVGAEKAAFIKDCAAAP